MLKGFHSNFDGLRRWGHLAVAFVAEPASAGPLAVLRIGLAGVLLIQAFAIAGNLPELYGGLGIVQRPLMESLTMSDVPRIGWVADALAPLGVSDTSCVRAVFLAYVAGLSCLLIGWHTRAAAVLAWSMQLMLKTTGVASAYGVDTFATIALFYCVWMPVGHAASADLLSGRVSGRPSPAARLALRVLQIHLCIAYLISGLEKASGIQWWNGEAIWRALMRPDLGRYDFAWLASVPWLAQLICFSTLVVEIGYPFLVWPSATRKPWAAMTIGLHVGIAVTMGLTSFSAVMIVLTAAAFLAPPGRPGAAKLLPGWRVLPRPFAFGEALVSR